MPCLAGPPKKNHPDLLCVGVASPNLAAGFARPVVAFLVFGRAVESRRRPPKCDVVKRMALSCKMNSFDPSLDHPVSATLSGHVSRSDPQRSPGAL